MILNLLLIVALGIVVFFHYVQGFFSAFLSAVIAVIAASLAISYHEPIVYKVFQGKLADSAFAMSLVALFAVVYLVLRVIFDKLVPGNVRLPAALDRIGGGIMGLIAGVFGVGIVAIAVQTLPYDASIGGYSRYELKEDRNVSVGGAGGGRAEDMQVVEELKGDKFEDQDKRSLWVPVDEIVLGFVQKLSDGGSLAGGQTLAAVHPNYVEEMYASRLGIQQGRSKTAVDIGPRTDVELKGVYRIEEAKQVDNEVKGIRDRHLEDTRKAKPNEALVVARVIFNRGATDKDGLVAFSCGSIRICANGKDYYAIGTLDAANTPPILYADKPDDFLFVQVGNDQGGADVVFSLDSNAVQGLGGKEKSNKPLKFVEGAFLEVKRLAQIELTDQKIEPGPPKPNKLVAVIHKPDVAKGRGSAQEGSAADTVQVPITVKEVIPAPVPLFTKVNVGTNARSGDGTMDSGSAKLQDKKFQSLELDGSRAVAILSKGPDANLVQDFYVPADKKMIVVAATPRGAEKWAWADQIGNIWLQDESDQQLKPHGAWARAKKGNAEFAVGRYNAEEEIGDAPKLDDASPTEVWLAFVVPTGTKLKELHYGDVILREVKMTVGGAAPAAKKAE